MLWLIFLFLFLVVAVVLVEAYIKRGKTRAKLPNQVTDQSELQFLFSKIKEFD